MTMPILTDYPFSAMPKIQIRVHKLHILYEGVHLLMYINTLR